MSNVLERTFNGATISQREADGYFNATAMCQAAGKKWADYWRLGNTDEFIQALAESTGIPVDSLVEMRSGRGGGTYVHPDIAIHLAQWCSAKFAVLVTGWVRELLTKGVVAINEGELDELELIVRQANQLLQLRNAQRATEQRVARVEVRADDAHRVATAALGAAQSNYGWYTVLGYCKLTGRSMSVKESARHGRELTAELAARGQSPQSVRDPRFGRVNTYPEELLRQHFCDAATPAAVA